MSNLDYDGPGVHDEEADLPYRSRRIWLLNNKLAVLAVLGFITIISAGYFILLNYDISGPGF